MQISHLLPAGRPSDVGMYRAALNWSGANQRYLDYQVVEPAGQQPRQGADLSPALDLKDTNRVGATQHVIDPGFLFGHGVERPALPHPCSHQVEGVLDGGQYA